MASATFCCASARKQGVFHGPFEALRPLRRVIRVLLGDGRRDFLGDGFSDAPGGRGLGLAGLG